MNVFGLSAMIDRPRMGHPRNAPEPQQNAAPARREPARRREWLGYRGNMAAPAVSVASPARHSRGGLVHATRFPSRRLKTAWHERS